MKVLEYINIKTLEIVNTNVPDLSIHKKIKWIDDDGNFQKHPIVLVDPKYWQIVENDYPIEMNQSNKNIIDSNEFQKIKGDKKREVKTIALTLILAILPEWKQRNYIARASELINKQLLGDTLTIEEQSEKDNIQAKWDEIKIIRSKSDLIENEIDELTTTNDINDYQINFNGE